MELHTRLSAILVEWTTALVDNDVSQVQEFLSKEPELLWTPIPHALDNLDDLDQRLTESNKLGSTFQPVSAIHFICLYDNQGDRFKLAAYLIEQSSLHDLDTRFWGECNNSTLHLACFLENAQIMRLLFKKGVSATPTNALGFLPSDMTAADAILYDLKKQKKQQSSRNRPVRPNYSTPNRFNLLRELAEETTSTPGEDQKKLELSLGRQKSEGRLFRKGRVKETQQKVQTEEEAELEEQRSKRQMEMVQLQKKSAVKTNPLFMKLEKKAYTLPNLSNKLVAASIKDEHDEPSYQPQSTQKRGSRVISSLKVNSFVSSSVFVQADDDAIEPKLPPTFIIMTDSYQTDDKQDDCKVCTTPPLNVNETQGQIFSTEPDELLDDAQSNTLPDDRPPNIVENNARQEEEEESSEDEDESDVEEYFDCNTNRTSTAVTSASSLDVVPKINYSPVETKTVYPDIRTYYEYNIISQQNQQPESDQEIESPGDHEEDEDEEEDEEDDEEDILPIQFATRLATPIYKSVTILNKDRSIRSPTSTTTSSNNTTVKEAHASSNLDVVVEETQIATRSAEAVIDAPLAEASKSSSLVGHQGSDVRTSSSTANINYEDAIATLKKLEKQDSKEMKRRSGSQKAAWTMSMSSWAAILDREFSLKDLGQEKKLKEMQKSIQSATKTEQEETTPSSSPTSGSPDYLGFGKWDLANHDPRPSLSKKATGKMLSLSLNFTKSATPAIPTATVQKSFSAVTSAPQIGDFPSLRAFNAVRRKPITSSVSVPNLHQKQQQQERDSSVEQYNITLDKTSVKKTGYGRLYLHVNGIQDILLPLPKDRAYVRCVVSDGRFEYMSRYETLSQNISYDYECVIDTHPDMIITISLHVRPDYVMKSRIPFSHLFSKKKKKEYLAGYVNKEDGAIGQARFALAHMLPACQTNPYLASLHCFNAWYSRSFKERRRQKKKVKDSDRDVLKVVGNFDVEMLYLPVEDYGQKPFPRNLRECDQIIKQLRQSVASKSSPSSSERYHTF